MAHVYFLSEFFKDFTCQYVSSCCSCYLFCTSIAFTFAVFSTSRFSPSMQINPNLKHILGFWQICALDLHSILLWHRSEVKSFQGLNNIVYPLQRCYCSFTGFILHSNSTHSRSVLRYCFLQ